MVDSFLEKAKETLIEAKKIVVISHYHPDADAYGSSCGLALGLRSLGKEVLVVNETPLVESYKIIPGVLEIVNTFPKDRYDVVVACDCGSAARVGDSMLPFLSTAPLLLNLDHHISNDRFAAINAVNENACSTSEIVFDLLKLMNIEITKDIATCLFAGIAGDTGSFRYSSAGVKAFSVATELVKAGARPDVIIGGLFGNSPLSAVQLQSEALRNVTMHYSGQVAELLVSNEMYSKYHAGIEDTEGLVEKARDIKGVQMSVLIKQDGNIWRISLRSRLNQYNVSNIASSFGGGGHILAAAFRWKNDLDTLRKTLFEKIAELFKL
jgi:bifunctional oligoribonuclease and PAP phosphatase NrnA